MRAPKPELSDFLLPNSTRQNPATEKATSHVIGLVAPVLNQEPYILEDDEAWEESDATWGDMVGSSRRREHEERTADDNASESSDGWWVSEAVDNEAYEVGCIFFDIVSPTGPEMRNREALATLHGLTALNDSYATCERYDEILNKHYRGRTVQEWVYLAAVGVDEWTHNMMAEVLIRQTQALAEQRIDNDVDAAAQQVGRNKRSYREYIRWRNLEGCYFGVMLYFAVGSGLDIRLIPRRYIMDAIEAGIVGFDVHGSYRHSQEDETGDILVYMSGTHQEKVTACLELVTKLSQRIAQAEDLGDREKEFLLRYVTMASLVNYMPMRWARTTPLHISPSRRERGEWSHVGKGRNFAVSYSSTRGGGSGAAPSTRKDPKSGARPSAEGVQAEAKPSKKHDNRSPTKSPGKSVERTTEMRSDRNQPEGAAPRPPPNQAKGTRSQSSDAPKDRVRSFPFTPTGLGTSAARLAATICESWS